MARTESRTLPSTNMNVVFYCPGCGKRQGEANVPMLSNDKRLDELSYCPPCSRVAKRPHFNPRGFAEFMSARPMNRDQALAMARALEQRRAQR